MTNEQREAIEYIQKQIDYFKEQIKFIEAVDCDYYEEEYELYKNRIKQFSTVLSLIKEQQEREELIKEYVHQEIVHYTETIEDYEDDDKKENKHYIEELKEKREHWKDIEKILQNKPKEELYMNWWRYGLYE